MAFRETLLRMAPGIFTPAGGRPRVLTIDQPEAKAFVRAAGIALYPPTGFPGSQTVMPNFDNPMTKDASVDGILRENPLIFAPVWRIAFRLGAIPLKVYEFTDSGGRRARREAMEHPAYKVLRSPNPDLTRNLLISGTVFSMYAYSGMGWYKERRDPLGPRIPSNPVVAVWPIPANLLQPIHSERRLLTGFNIRTFGGDVINLPARDVCYFRLMPDIANWTKGVAPTGPLSDMADFSTAGMEAMRNLFRSSLLARIFMNLHGQVLDEDLINRLRAEVEVAAANPYAVPIMEGGATLDAMGQGADPNLLGNSFELTKGVVNDAFGMPKDQDNLAMFYGEVIQPVADAIEQELERSFMTEFEGEAFPQFAFRELLEGDPLTRAKLHQTKILSGQETPNEAREESDRPPVPGGDQAFVPLNEVPMTDASADKTPRKKDTAGGLGGDVGKGTTAKLQLPKAAAESGAIKARGETIRHNWTGVREKVLVGQREGLERRLRGVIQNEAQQLRELQAPQGLGAIPARSRMRSEAFPDERVEAILKVSDMAIEGHLDTFMLQVAARAGGVAIDLVGDQEATYRQEAASVMVAARVATISARFGERRREHLRAVLSESQDQTIRQLDDRLRAEWSTLADHLVGRIGETETQWAFERGAAIGWASAGQEDLIVVRTGDACRTGMCLEVATAGRYQLSDVPTPLHPGCRCFVLPARLVE